MFAFTPKQLVKFYSVPSVVRSPENEANPKQGTVRVWTEDIPFQSLDQALGTLSADSPIMELVTARLAGKYVPPYSLVNKVPADSREASTQAIQTVSYEELANRNMALVKAQALIELDCAQGRQRFLEAIEFGPGKTQTSLLTEPSAWAYVPLHSIGQSLQKLICDKRLTAPDNTPAPPKPKTQTNSPHN
jgi:hypothetical protein